MQKFNLNKYKNILVGIVLSISIFSFNTQKSYAIPVVCVNCYDVVNGISNTISSSFNSFSNASSQWTNWQQYYKEYFGDFIQKQIKNRIIKQIQDQTIAWINSGFKGKPLFLENPEQFFNNIMIDQLAIVKNKMIGDLNGFNKTIAQQLIKDVANESKIFQQQMNYTIATDLCKGLKEKLNSYQSQPNSDQKTKLIASTNEQIKLVCSGATTTRDTNAKACASNFLCGGWTGILTKTKNLDVTSDAGKLMLAQKELKNNTTAETQKVKEDVANGGGVMSQKVCVKEVDVDGRKICKQYQTVTPGSAIAAQLAQVVTTPMQQLLSVDGNKEGSFLSPIVTAFVNKILNEGVNKINGVLTDASASLNNALAGLSGDINDLTKETIGDINSGFNDIKNDINGNGVSSGLGTQADKEIYALSIKDRDELVGSLKPLYDKNTKSSATTLGFIKKELDAYNETMDAYNSVSACYKQKAEAYPAYVKYPESIPQDIKDRAAILNSAIVGLEDIYRNGTAAINNFTSLYNQMAVATDFRVFESLKVKFDAASEQIPSEQYWTLRDLDNTNSSPSLYSKLKAEAQSLVVDKYFGGGDNQSVTLSPLHTCQNINPYANQNNNN